MQPLPREDVGAAFARLQQGLRSYLRRRLRDPTQAEDLLQDVFVKALASQRAGRRIDNFTGWLYAAARTTLVDHYRATGATMQALDEQLPEVQAEDFSLHQELARCLRPFVEQLAPIYRDTLIATEFEGHTLRSLAAKHKVSVSAMKSRAARGRAMLKEKVLACCRVEIADGMVSDYHRISPSPTPSRCGGKCA